MSGQAKTDLADLLRKIARLVEERGWNQEDFARIAGLNRQTVRQILHQKANRRVRNVTISRCAKAFGLSVSDLRDLPLDRLLLRVQTASGTNSSQIVGRLYEQATQPELQAWLERNPDRARELTPDDIDELLSLQGTGGPLTRIGVDYFVGLLERKRKLIQQIHIVAGTEYFDLLEQLVRLMYDKVQPYREQA